MVDQLMFPSPTGLRPLMLVAMSFGVILFVPSLFWLTNAADTHPLRANIRRLFRNLTKYFLIAEVHERRVMADNENDAPLGEFAKQLPE